MNYKEILSSMLDQAQKLGATESDVIIMESSSLNTEVRLGNLIGTEFSENLSVGLRVIINQQQAIVATSNFSKESIKETVQKAIDMARVTPPNPHLRVAKSGEFAENIEDLDLHDSNEPSTESLIEKAKCAEDAAFSNSLITNSEGSSAFYSKNNIYFATSNGFYKNYKTSKGGIALEVIAKDKDGSMQTGSAYSIARFTKDLEFPETLGMQAARRAVDKLGPRKISTCEMPVIFDYKVARGILGSFAGAINGASISRGASFLINHLNKEIFSPNITIIDDPLILRGLNSRPFDAEAIAVNKLQIVDKGVLNYYLLDLQTASKLNMETTGHAVRGLSTAPSPSPSNLYILAGEHSLQELIKSLNKGLLITEIFGHGANIITGEFSQGAAGFYIENGEIAYPVNEITIASNLNSMFKQMIPADDLKFESNINTPSLLIERMTIGGK